MNDIVVIEITDDGCGTAAELLPKIFDPFFTSKSVGSGTGPGSSLSHGSVAEHGGRIEVESTVGTGSRVLLPIHPSPRPMPNEDELAA